MTQDWSWYHSKAANTLALTLARQGKTLQEIIDNIKDTNWLPDRCVYPCAKQAVDWVKGNIK